MTGIDRSKIASMIYGIYQNNSHYNILVIRKRKKTVVNVKESVVVGYGNGFSPVVN